MGSPAIHKFAKYLVVANDHIRKEPFLDMYTAAKAITPIYSLGLSLEALKEVKGADSKLRALYRGPSAEIDSTIFELLVAAAFASKGHDVAFIEENAKKKTPAEWDADMEACFESFKVCDCGPCEHIRSEHRQAKLDAGELSE